MVSALTLYVAATAVAALCEIAPISTTNKLCQRRSTEAQTSTHRHKLNILFKLRQSNRTGLVRICQLENGHYFAAQADIVGAVCDCASAIQFLQGDGSVVVHINLCGREWVWDGLRDMCVYVSTNSVARQRRNVAPSWEWTTVPHQQQYASVQTLKTTDAMTQCKGATQKTGGYACHPLWQ